MIKYTVWTGSKFKGAWDSKDQAVAYMGHRHKPERKQWTLVAVDLDKNLSAEVEKSASVIEAAQLKAAIKQHPGLVHHLKAESIEATSDGKISH